jgi:transposase-like protein
VTLEPLGPELAERGTSKSAVSRRFVEVTSKKVDQWVGRSLEGVDMVAILVDGIHVDEHVFLVALGIDIDGNKQVLGVREGATENATCCREVLSALRERGLANRQGNALRARRRQGTRACGARRLRRTRTPAAMLGA